MMFTMLSIGTAELALAGLVWLTAACLGLMNSVYTQCLVYGACALTLAVVATPADLLSSVILTALLLLAFFVGLSTSPTLV